MPVEELSTSTLILDEATSTDSLADEQVGMDGGGVPSPDFLSGGESGCPVGYTCFTDAEMTSMENQLNYAVIILFVIAIVLVLDFVRRLFAPRKKL